MQNEKNCEIDTQNKIKITHITQKHTKTHTSIHTLHTTSTQNYYKII